MVYSTGNRGPRLRGSLNRRRLIGGAALGGAGGFLLAACGSDKPAEEQAAGTGAAGSAGTKATQGEPQRGGTLSFSIAGDPPNLDMHANSTYQVNHPVQPLYNQLIRFKPEVAVESPDSVTGDLAKSWEQSGDGLTYTFKLNEGVTFHDGKPFTSADVKASLERVANPPRGVTSPRRDQLEALERVETPDASTVVLTLKRPSPSLLMILAQGWMSIYSAQDIAGGFDFKAKTNGTGPFKLKEWLRGNRITYDVNESYFVKGQPYLKGLTCFIIPDPSTAVASFQSGELLFNQRFTPSEVKSLEATLAKRMVIERTPAVSFETLNFGPNAPWRDERVRRAVSLVLDRQASIELLQEGEAEVGAYMSAGGTWALPENDLKAVPGYGPFSDRALTEAKALLAAAGVHNGHETTLLTRQGSTYERLTLFIIDALKKVGINGKARILETASSYPDLDNRNFDLAPWSHSAALDDPDGMYAEFYLTTSPRNYSDIGSKEVDALFLRQSQTLDQAERVKLVHEMERKAAPLYSKVVLNWRTRAWTWWNTVQGYTAHVGLFNNNRFAEVWLQQK